MKKLFLLAIVFGSFYVAQAQPSNPINPVPLDGGLSLLIAGGAALGYKAYKNKKSK
jgi:hypothetical protein